MNNKSLVIITLKQNCTFTHPLGDDIPPLSSVTVLFRLLTGWPLGDTGEVQLLSCSVDKTEKDQPQKPKNNQLVLRSAKIFIFLACTRLTLFCCTNV